jgi:hypothetical protein
LFADGGRALRVDVPCAEQLHAIEHHWQACAVADMLLCYHTCAKQRLRGNKLGTLTLPSLDDVRSEWKRRRASAGSVIVPASATVPAIKSSARAHKQPRAEGSRLHRSRDGEPTSRDAAAADADDAAVDNDPHPIGTAGVVRSNSEPASTTVDVGGAWGSISVE